MTPSSTNRDDAGFTLVEVLVAIVIEAIIVGALGMAFVGILKSSTTVNQSLSRSGDARIAAAYIISDARNSSGPEVSTTTTSCADASPPVAGGSLVVQFGWNTTAALTGVSKSNVVDYVLASNKLMRRECQNNVLVSDRVVASNVSSVAISCLPTATPQCSGTPTSITVTITETTDSSGNSYVYSLTGTFRKLIGGGVVVTAPSNPQSVILLGSGTTCVSGATGLSMSTSAHITVYGTAVINNTDSGSCTAMNMTTSSSFQAGQTKILAGGTCTANTSAVCPTTTSYTPAITDPYASLAAPSAAALGLSAQSGCPGGIAQPGVYASTLSVTTSSSCQLQPGVYILNNGLSISTSAHLTSAAGGVLLYIAGGSFSSSTSATINIAAQTTNPWAGIAIWQAKTDTNTLSFSTSGAVTIDGFIYAPKATVNMSTSAANPTIKGIVAQNIIMTTSANLVIGTPSTTPLSIPTPATIGPWTVNKAFSATINAAGGDGNYIWSATGLPVGLTMNASTGVISGTPTATGSSAVTVTLNDQLGDAQATKAYTLVINVAPSISTASLPQAEKTAAYNQTVAGSGGATPYSWSATGLPTGLSINSSTGAITGTPTGSTATATITLVDNSGSTVSKNLSITVINGPTITATTFANGVTGTAYSKTLAGTGGTTAYSWTATGLPPGLSLASGTGVISGTPTPPASGNYTVAITLTDAVGGTATTSLPFVIQPKIVSVTLSNKTTAPAGTAGKMDAGDKITIVYSDQMKVSGFCNTWSGDTSAQTLTGNNLLVNVTNGGAANDTLAISNTGGTGCTSPTFGGLNLASTGYVTGNVAFGGASGNTSVTWTPSTHTLVITLGAVSVAGNVGTVAANTAPTYTAPAAQVDSNNLALSSSTFVLPAAKQF